MKNTVGYLPVLDESGVVTTEPRSSVPIVTYVSRQKTGRRLTEEDHQGLIRSLLELEEEGLIELNIAVMETLTFSKQIETVARSTVSFFKLLAISVFYSIGCQIMVGVHGNGLTVSHHHFLRRLD